jgi:hypothetical protein
MLAIIERKDWLDFKNSTYFWSMTISLLLLYLGIVGYSYYQFERVASPKRTNVVLVDEVRNLTSEDRNHLSGMLFRISTVLDDTPPLIADAYEAERQTVARDGSVDAIIKKLQGVYNEFDEWQARLQNARSGAYFRDQISYIMGNPSDERYVQSAASDYETFLQRWNKIQNKNDDDISKMVNTERFRFNLAIYEFKTLVDQREKRLNEMRTILQ